MVDSNKRLDSLHALRGIASLWVASFHWGLTQGWGSTWLGSTIWSNGFLGVDLFLVLSGFVNFLLVQKISQTQTHAWWSYLVRRFVKIVIPTWISVILLAAVSWHKFGMEHYAKALFHSFIFVPTGLSGAPFYGYMFHVVAWSLFYEMLFYFCVSFTLIFKKYRFFRLAILIFLLPLFNLGSWWNPYEPQRTTALQFQHVLTLGFVNPIMLNFGLGWIGARLYLWFLTSTIDLKKPALKKILGFGIILVLLIAGAFLAFTPVQKHGIWPNGLCCAALVTLLAIHEKCFHQKYHALLIYFGSLSFPLFLTHTTVVAFWEQLWPKFHHKIPYSFAVGLCLVLTLIAAHCFKKVLNFPSFLKQYPKPN